MSAGSFKSVLLPFSPGLTQVGKNTAGLAGLAAFPSQTPLVPICISSLPSWLYFWTMPSEFPPIQMLSS